MRSLHRLYEATAIEGGLFQLGVLQKVSNTKLNLH